MLLPCCDHAALQANSQGHAQHGRARYGMCEITSAVSRRPVSDLPNFGFFRLPRGLSRVAVRIFPATRGLSRRTRPMLIPTYHAGLCPGLEKSLAKWHGRSTVGTWQGHGKDTI
jgi:hypothetical protein